MKKKATGLTSFPLSNVPGSENSEIHFIEEEDAEASNHGGFNQIGVEGFSKNLEIKQDHKNRFNLIGYDNGSFNSYPPLAKPLNVDRTSQHKADPPSETDIFEKMKDDQILTTDEIQDYNKKITISNLYNFSKINKKSANFKINIAKVNKNMKKELIKLNSALNGLGYKNLIKIAQYSDPTYQADSAFTYFLNNIVLITDVYKGDYSFPNVDPAHGGVGEVKNFWKSKWNKREKVNKGEYKNFLLQGKERFITPNDPDSWDDKLINEIENRYNEIVDIFPKSAETPASAGGSGSAVSTQPVTVPRTASGWEKYKKSGDTEGKIADIWGDPSKKRPNKSDGSMYDDTFSSFVTWWKTLQENQKYKESVLATLQGLNSPSAAPPAATTVTVTQSPARAVVSRRSLTTIELNGQTKNVAPLGSAYGGDTILIDIDSLNTDKPILYLLDNKTGTTTEMGSAQFGRVRQFLGSGAEKVRARRALTNAGVSEDKINAFFKYMGLYRKSIRRDGPFSTQKGRERRQEALTEAGRKLQTASSARQSRLDNLKKKGII